MNRFLIHLLNPLVHLIMTFMLLVFILNFDWAFTIEFVIVFFGLSAVINAGTFVFLYEKATWKYYFSSVGLFVSLPLLYLAFMITIGEPSSQGDEGNIAEGLVLVMVLFISIIAIVVGNLIGLILKKCFK
ncbi:hypothetical protein [Paenibacillus abyssi]|uniref:Uncharacterized protein n=1 Tax=Paenibacillus abyssi TaxID=1340531 RepID=A0A917LF82_9BACL|nr:hypothetical protein [Paenibacillus abyssi]GGG17385.1 hypothetical protein GCM10010916_37790 [Paenibacillus abyssi]